MGPRVSVLQEASSHGVHIAARRVRYLQLNGGGVRGFALLGVHKYLLENQAVLRGAVGVSVGAIVALLIALGLSAKECLSIFASCVHSDIFGHTRLRHTPCGFGWHSMDHLRSLLNKVLLQHGFAEDVSLREFTKQMNFDLRIAVTSKRVVVLSAGEHPHISLVDATLASCAVPFFFEPQTIRGMSGCYSDGGHGDMLPDQWPAVNKLRTLHVLLYTPSQNRIPSSRDEIYQRSVVIDTTIQATFDTHMTDKKISLLVRRGYNAAAGHFQREHGKDGAK